MRTTKVILEGRIVRLEEQLTKSDMAKEAYEEVTEQFDKLYDKKVEECQVLKSTINRQERSNARHRVVLETLLGELNLLRELNGLSPKSKEEVLEKMQGYGYNGSSMGSSLSNL